MSSPSRVSAGVPDGGRFAPNGRSESDLTLTDPADAAPTRFDVEEARQRMNALGSSVRPMYRTDWERINGGHGPTVQQARQETRHRSETNTAICAARAEYRRLLAAYEASDKTQDDDMIQCRSCGTHISKFDGPCPTCGEQ